MRRLTPVLSALLFSLALHPAWSADEVPPPVQPTTQPAAATTPAPPTVDPLPAAAELLKALPQVAALAEKDGKALWSSAAASFTVVEVDKDGNAVVETAAGKVAVLRRLLVDNRLDAVDALPRLVDQAKAAQVAIDGFVLREGPLTGLHLYSATTVVLAEGVVRKVAVPTADREADRGKVAAASERVVQAMARTTLDDLGKRTLEDVVRRLSRDDGNEQVDEVSPSFARRVVRSGWLRQFFGPEQLAAVKDLEQAIAVGEHYDPAVLFEGPNLRLAQVRDAFGRSGRWILTTPARSAFLQPHEAPLYYWAFGEQKPLLVVDLPAGADPTSSEPEPTGARIYQDQALLASWSRERGFQVNKDDWRKAVPARNRKGIDPNAVSDFMPPHVLITALNGDIIRLATAHGLLTPPKNGTAPEVERFLAEAAKSLPDPAHLDLIGEYVFAYVYDSPDSRFPFLIGNKAVKGDIHQTAAQTIATASCGMIRGDCDDLSELYEVIAERQGRTAHVIALPQHAALSFAEKKEDGNWHTYVLQTGPALEFSDAKLPGALEKLYKSFDENDSFDPNGLGLLLRFSGENTRSTWRLSWRIFSEPEYAKTMIDVQKDWHFQTYQRGIDKMKKLIAGGDQDNANFRELSGLYSFTGQFAEAVEYHEEAIKRTSDPDNKLHLAIELTQHLFSAKQDERARQVALDVLDRQLPALRKDPQFKAKIEASQAQLGLELAGSLSHGKAHDLALRALKDTLLDDTAAKIEQVGQWLVSPRYNQKTWENSPQLLGLRRQLEMYTAMGVEVLSGAPADELPKSADLQTLARSIQDWLNHVAFHDIDEPEDALSRYSVAGRYYATMLGEDRLLALVEAAELPKKADYDHAKRIGGLAQLQLDLPWIKLSVPFWTTRLMELFEKERTTLDKAQVARLYKQVQEAHRASSKLGLEHQLFDRNLHLCGVIAAVVAQDADGLRERLRHVKAKDDKRLRDDTAQWLGDVARFVPLDWYRQVAQIWKDELNYKPKYFWIAWRAALNGGPQHALEVAKLAAETFKDDRSFADEYELMTRLFAKPAAKPDAAPPAPGVGK